MLIKPSTPKKWILIVSGIIALMEIVVSISLVLAPETVMENVDLEAKGVDYVIHMWAARQLALGVIFAYATFKRSTPMLSLSYLFFLVMFIGDFCIGLFQNEMPLVGSAVVMCLVSVGMLVVLNKKK